MRRVTIHPAIQDRAPMVERLPDDGVEGMAKLVDLVNARGTKAVTVWREDGTVLEYQAGENED